MKQLDGFGIGYLLVSIPKEVYFGFTILAVLVYLIANFNVNLILAGFIFLVLLSAAALLHSALKPKNPAE